MLNPCVEHDSSRIRYFHYRAAAWIGYYWLFPDIGYFLYNYSFKIHELPGGKNVWKYLIMVRSMAVQ